MEKKNKCELREKLRLYNSMTKQKEVLKPLVEGKIRLYVCGVTAYDFSHLGHARASVAFDVLYRYLLHLEYDVTYVRNFTDIDDKIIDRANAMRVDPLSLSDRFCRAYNEDMADLQCLPPNLQPRVSDHMEQIKAMIQQIIDNDIAYKVDGGDVFFSVDRSPNYGQFSRQDLDNHRAGERVAEDPRKLNQADFALWKAAKPGEPISWESPWGPGRPGWHIECSAMSAHHLSHKFDIHGGGIDLIFPHHENEIAQSRAACAEARISCWMHNGLFTINNQKMSKSDRNFIQIRYITERYHPLAVRHFLISAHYRSHLNYSPLQLEGSSDAVYYIYQVIHDSEDALSTFKQEIESTEQPNDETGKLLPAAQECTSKLWREFYSKMSDDLSTAHILSGAFQDALKFLNSNLNTLKKHKQRQRQFAVVAQSLSEIKTQIKEVLGILGLLVLPVQPLTYERVLEELKQKALRRADLQQADVERLIRERALARKNKEFAKSDQIRASLMAKGIALMDLGENTDWRPCVATPLA
ncbi:cysteine--tRNA ligase 2, cytoplasmic-like [Punica granatum]|uniref:cysteine--tRNA ligase n=2 Tax=Punica granatum TaxID=22663 RepID=A0A6P8CV06_PUNGR|nr:cysteine--tRNA ligase 2, cytoplasmic-like [Punica granatum]